MSKFGSLEYRQEMSQALKGHPVSEKTRRKISKGHKGQIPWNKGTKGLYGEEYRAKISKSLIGRPSPMKGKQHSLETRIKISNAQRGEKSSNWRGGKSLLDKLIRRSVIYSLWRQAVFTRDAFKCVVCGKKGGQLNAHHVHPFAESLKENNIISLGQALRTEELWNIDDGITLCEKCHRVRHSKMKEASLIDTEQWYTFQCKLPPAVYELLENELERIRLLANIDPDDRLPDIVRDGLCMEYLVANSATTPDESVV